MILLGLGSDSRLGYQSQSKKKFQGLLTVHWSLLYLLPSTEVVTVVVENTDSAIAKCIGKPETGISKALQ